MALFNEVAHSPCITVNVPTRKALIGHIEEHKQVSFLDVHMKGGGQRREKQTEKTS